MNATIEQYLYKTIQRLKSEHVRLHDTTHTIYFKVPYTRLLNYVSEYFYGLSTTDIKTMCESTLNHDNFTMCENHVKINLRNS